MMSRIELVLTLFGPVIFAVGNRPFWLVPVWATFCALYWMWRTREGRRAAAAVAFDPDIPYWYRLFSDFAMFLAVAVAFNAAHAAVYLIASLIP